MNIMLPLFKNLLGSRAKIFIQFKLGVPERTFMRLHSLSGISIKRYCYI